MRLFLTVLLACLLASPVHAALRLGQPFGEHMVLPRDVVVVLWGTGAPGGDTVRVAIQGQTATGHADWSGRWMVELEPLRAGGPFQMNVTVGGLGPVVPSSAANETAGLELNDVLVGDLVPLSQIPKADVTSAGPSGAGAKLREHPYAFVRVYSVGGLPESSRWTLVRQDTVPPGLETLFAAGRDIYAVTKIPLGVLGAALPAQCAPSTACSAH